MSQIRKNNFDGFSIKIFQDEDGDWLAHFIEYQIFLLLPMMPMRL